MSSDVVTLRIPTDTLTQLDTLARRRGTTRTNILLEAIDHALTHESDLRTARLNEARLRLRPALDAQNTFLGQNAISDEWRTI